jgi:hypothetical protein
MKMLKVAVLALVMAAMVTPVIAEDRLSLSGEMRVRGWHVDADQDWSDDDSTETWGDQRLRIGGKIAVAEGVSVTFRTDITESTWGTTGSGNGFGSGRSGASQQWDRAHIDLAKGNWHLRAGQFYQGYGKTYALDTQDNGLSVDYVVGDGSINAFFMVDNDNGGNDQSDAFLSGLKYSGKFDKIALNVFAANYNQNGNGSTDTDTGIFTNNDADITLIGVDVTVPFEAFKLVAELDFFDGDSARNEGGVATGKQLDAYGTQLMLDGSFAMSDALTLGGQFFYGAGDDEDVQITSIGNGFNSWDPVMDVGTSLSNWSITYGNPFNVASVARYEGQDVAVTSAGSVGARLYTNYDVNSDLTLGASAGYFVSEEDKIADIEVMALAGGLVYKVMENTSLQLQLQYIDGTLNETTATTAAGLDGDQDFDNFSAGTGLFVKF